MSDAKFVIVLVLLLIFFLIGLFGSYIEGAAISLLAAWGIWSDVRIDRLKQRLRNYTDAQNERLVEACRGCNYDDRN